MSERASKAELEEAKRLWEEGGLTIDGICDQVGRSAPWLYWQAHHGGWLKRSRKREHITKRLKSSLHGTRTTLGGKPVLSAAGWDARHREEDAHHDLTLYGALLPFVRFLRRHRYVVTAEGAGLYRVGNKLMGAQGLVALAERERRLLRDKNPPIISRY